MLSIETLETFFYFFSYIFFKIIFRFFVRFFVFKNINTSLEVQNSPDPDPGYNLDHAILSHLINQHWINQHY